MAVTIQDDMLEIAEELPPEECAQLLVALIKYGIHGEDAEGSGTWHMLYRSMKPRIQISAEKLAAIQKMNAARAKKQAASKTSKPQVASDSVVRERRTKTSHDTNGGDRRTKTSNEAVETPRRDPSTEKRREEMRGDEKRGDEMRGVQGGGAKTAPSPAAPQKRFRPPTAEEVEAFATSHDIALDAEAFCDFYASKGWKVGSSPMKDWHAAARNWARRDAQATKTTTAEEAKLDEIFAKYDA